MKGKQLGDLLFLQLAIRHEELMAQLYDVFRVQVTCSSDFWEQLCREEMSHAERLEWLLHEVKAGKAQLDPKRHATNLIKASIDSLESKVKTWKKWGVDKADAYQYALLLEGGIIEDRFFRPTENDSTEVQEVFYEMKAGCNSHFQRLREEYEKNNLSAGFFVHLKAKCKSLFS